MSSGVSGCSTRFHYIQTSKPSNPTSPGITWLRTSDLTCFVYDVTNNRWVSIGTPGQTTVSGANNAATGDQNGRFHRIVQDAAGKVWRPYQDMVVVGMYISNTVVANASHHVELRDNTTVLTQVDWDGVNTFVSETKDVEIDQDAQINFLLDFGSGTAPNRWQAGVWWKLRIDGF